MMVPGKLYRLKRRTFISKDRRSTQHNGANQPALELGEVVLMVGHTQHRWWKVISGETIGYIWLQTNFTQEDLFEEVEGE